MFTPSKQRPWIGVFLTATPEPLQLFLKYGSHKSTSLSDLIYHTKNKTEQLQQELDTPIPDTPSLQDGWRSNIGDYHQLTRIEKEWIKSKNDPFHKLYDEMKTIFSGVQYDSIIEVIKNDFDYDYVEPYYFLEYNDLYSVIEETTKSGEKWLVFINSEERGTEVCQTLREKDISACFLSSNRVKKNNSPEQETFNNICVDSKFNESVLITTSLLDNGVNIKDTSVTNIVIESTSKTTFLQMLGRVRAKQEDGTIQKINLYIKAVSNHTLNGFRNNTNHRVDAGIPILLKSYREYLDIKVKPHDSPHTILNYVIEYIYGSGTGEVNASFTKLRDKYEIEKMLCITFYGHKNKQEQYSVLLNIPYFLFCLYEKYYYDKSFREKQSSAYTYLHEQLSWLGKTYDNNNWVNCDGILKLIDLLDTQTNEAPIMGMEIDNFRDLCCTYIKMIPEVPHVFMKDASRYSNKKSSYKSPGKNKLNQTFLALELPYEIVSDTKNAARKTQWTIRKNELNFYLYQMLNTAFNVEELLCFTNICLNKVEAYHRISFEKLQTMQSIKSDYVLARIFTNEFFSVLGQPYYFVYQSREMQYLLLKNDAITYLNKHLGKTLKSTQEKFRFYEDIKKDIYENPLLPEVDYEKIIHSASDVYPSITMLNDIFMKLGFPYFLYFDQSKELFFNDEIVPWKLIQTNLYILLNDSVMNINSSEIQYQNMLHNIVDELLLHTELYDEIKKELLLLKEKNTYTFEDTYSAAKAFDFLGLQYDFCLCTNERDSCIYLQTISEPKFNNRRKHFSTPLDKRKVGLISRYNGADTEIIRRYS